MSKYYFELQCNCTSFPEHWCTYFPVHPYNRITVGRCPSMQITFRNQHVSGLQLVFMQRKQGGVIVRNYGRNPIDIVGTGGDVLQIMRGSFIIFPNEEVVLPGGDRLRLVTKITNSIDITTPPPTIVHSSPEHLLEEREEKTSFLHQEINMHQSAYLSPISG